MICEESISRVFATPSFNLYNSDYHCNRWSLGQDWFNTVDFFTMLVNSCRCWCDKFLLIKDSPICSGDVFRNYIWHDKWYDMSNNMCSCFIHHSLCHYYPIKVPCSPRESESKFGSLLWICDTHSCASLAYKYQRDKNWTLGVSTLQALDDTSLPDTP